MHSLYAGIIVLIIAMTVTSIALSGAISQNNNNIIAGQQNLKTQFDTTTSQYKSLSPYFQNLSVMADFQNFHDSIQSIESEWNPDILCSSMLKNKKCTSNLASEQFNLSQMEVYYALYFNSLNGAIAIYNNISGMSSQELKDYEATLDSQLNEKSIILQGGSQQLPTTMYSSPRGIAFNPGSFRKDIEKNYNANLTENSVLAMMISRNSNFNLDATYAEMMQNSLEAYYISRENFAFYTKFYKMTPENDPLILFLQKPANGTIISRIIRKQIVLAEYDRLAKMQN